MKENEKYNQNSDINEYLVFAFENLNKSQSEIIKDLKKGQSYVSALMNGKKKVGKDVANQLANLYGFDAGSILTGEMNNEPQPKISYENGKGRPFINVDWELGFKTAFDENQSIEFNIDFPPANKETIKWFRGKGHSMIGEIDSGDYIALEEIKDFSWFPLGCIYGIVTKNNLRTIKRISKSEKKDHYLLLSNNPDKIKYPDDDIPKDFISQLFKVVYVIKDLNE